MPLSVARTRAAQPRNRGSAKPAMPPDGRGRVKAFCQARAAHRSEVAEDYVELIADLIDVHGEARLVEMAKHLGITQATVSTTVSRLQRDGLVEHRRYRSIFLTEAGRDLAQMARRRHRLVVAFLRALQGKRMRSAAIKRAVQGIVPGCL
jgi:DtxR family transcriptional regulator, manganese transport regulator